MKLRRNCQTTGESQLARASPSPLFALNSPNALFETGLHICPPEKSRASDALHCRVVHSLQSGLSRKNREKRALIAHRGGREARNSLLFRLRGGGRGIRTCCTLLVILQEPMCAQRTADSATYTSHLENCLSRRIGGSSPFSYFGERRTPSDCRTRNRRF
jgi:hypothetical protein